jgi:hypothetical protein
MALLQETGMHFDMPLEECRKGMSRLAYITVELYRQFDPQRAGRVANDEGELEFFDVDLSLMPLGDILDYDCTATSLSVNKEVQKQANIIFLQTLAELLDRMGAVLQGAISPQVGMMPELQKFLLECVKVYWTIARDIARSFEKTDITQYLPELPAIVKAAYGQNQAEGGMRGGPAGLIEGSPGAPGQPGMGALPGGLSGIAAQLLGGAGEQGGGPEVLPGPGEGI